MQTPLQQALTRRRFMALTGGGLGATVLGATVLGACSSDSSSDASGSASSGGSGDLTVVRSQLSWIPNVEFGAYWIGLQQGLYEDEGIQLEYIPGGPNASNSTQVIAAGGADVAHSTDFISLMDAVIEGNDFVLWAVKLQKSPLGFMWLPSAGISGPEDLVGKRVGGVQGDETMIDAVFTANDLEPDYEFVPIGFDPQPLVDGEVDTMTVFVTNQPLTLQVEGIENETASISEWGLPQYADVMFCERSYLEEHRDTVVGYCTATIKGWELNAQDLELAPQLVIDDYGADQGLSLEQQILNNEAQQPLMVSEVTEEKGLMRISRAVMEDQMYPALAAVGRTGLPPVDQLVDESILDDVYGDKNSLTA